MFKGIERPVSSPPAQRQKYNLGQRTRTGSCLHPNLAEWDMLVLFRISSMWVATKIGLRLERNLTTPNGN